MFQGVIFVNQFIVETRAATEEITPEYAYASIIDGRINKTAREWENASKVDVNLYSNSSQTDKGIPIELWVLQNASDLYILVRFDLVAHAPNEFIGLVISEDDTEDNDSFIDTKIVQWVDLGGDDEHRAYLDYHIEDGVFLRDEKSDGEGYARLDDTTVIYEFRIPVNASEEDDEDAFLDFGEAFAFKIIYGESASYPSGILKSNVVLINIEYAPKPPVNPYLLANNIFLIIIFMTIGVLFAYYMFKVITLKKIVERQKEKVS